jgi:hypothetical protein
VLVLVFTLEPHQLVRVAVEMVATTLLVHLAVPTQAVVVVAVGMTVVLPKLAAMAAAAS